MVRRRARRYSRKKSFTISAIETGAALSLASSAGVDTAIQEALGGGNLAGALGTIQTNVASNKNKIIGTLGAAFIGKMLAKSFGNGQLAKLGPIRIKA